MKEKTIEIPGIGPVLMKINRRAKHINIRIKPGGEVRVTIPPGVLFRYAEKIVYKRIDWIKKHVERIHRDNPPTQTQTSEQKKEIIEAMRREAKLHLPPRVQQLADLHRLRYNKVVINSARTRWGSCSSRTGNINLSLFLMKLPEHLIDYIILHELAHTKVMRHDRKFYKLLDRLTGGRTAEFKRELRQYSLHV